MNYKEQLENIGKMNFPIKAIFIDEEVLVLGPIHRFKPYKNTHIDNSQLMCNGKGKRFITFAFYLYVNGEQLATPPERPKDYKSPFEKLLERQK